MKTVIILSVTLWLAALRAPGAESKLRFNRDIRPLMSDTCFHCHGPDKNSRKAGLRLDIREDALKPAKSGELPIVPGKPDESEIIKRIFAEDKDDLMPPVEAHKTFTPQQKEIFKRWVAQGAEYEPHWAYTPLVKPPVPKIQGSSIKVQNSIDAFIAEKLVEKNISPSAGADPRTLLRRLSLDLTGLPPTLEEMNAFVEASGKNPQAAYEAAVERLLQSPHYGERMAVWWLDVARFSDTVGYHGDQNIRNFPYRDYVIDAFNKNKPFDLFTKEQIAGDLLPNPTTEQIIATGFNRLNMVTREGGAQPEEYLATYGAERVRTIGGAFLGATLGCCECHDHKFDPFTAKDFYSMQAFFADVKQMGVYADYSSNKDPESKGLNNESPFPPEMEVENAYLKTQMASIRSQMHVLAKNAAEAWQKDAKAKAEFEKWRDSSLAFFKSNPNGWITPNPQVTIASATPLNVKGAGKGKPAAKAQPKVAEDISKALPTFRVEVDGRIIYLGQTADNSQITLQAPVGWVSAIRVELLPDGQHKGSILRNGQEAAAKLKLSASLNKANATKPQPLAFRQAEANFKTARYNSGAEIIGINDVWMTSAKEWNQKHVAICLLEKPVKIDAGDTLTVQIADNQAGCVRVSVSPFAPVSLRGEPSLAALLPAIEARNDGALEAYLSGTTVNETALKEYAGLHAKFLECRDGKTYTVVTQARPTPLTVRVLPRGNWMDQSGAITPPASPEFLPTVFKPKEGQRLTRLELAKWLCSQENPLTPRAQMNRLWKQFFGNGLSSIVDDLGAQGEPPSHPELLDWIAAEFRDSGWDMKHMIRLFVLSNTYRQSSSLRPELRDIDPNNRLLASQNPRRLDAEFIRDNALFIAGQINLDIGGPSVKPYQPAGYYANIQFPDRSYVSDTDSHQWRRGLYMHWQRTFLHPMLANFDAPMRDECTANRPLSNTPQQALTLLNDPTFVEAARVFAERLLNEKSLDDTTRINRAFELAAGRPVKEKEKASLLNFLKTQRNCYKGDSVAADKMDRIGLAPVAEKLDRVELAAWTSVCRVILNLHETITRY